MYILTRHPSIHPSILQYVKLQPHSGTDLAQATITHIHILPGGPSYSSTAARGAPIRTHNC